MDTRILLYAFGMWFIFVIAAILNGAFRVAFITPRVGEHAGHVISTFIFMGVILAGTYLFLIACFKIHSHLHKGLTVAILLTIM